MQQVVDVMMPLEQVRQKLFQVRQFEDDQLASFAAPVSLYPGDHHVVRLDHVQLDHRRNALVEHHHLKNFRIKLHLHDLNWITLKNNGELFHNSTGFENSFVTDFFENKQTEEITYLT